MAGGQSDTSYSAMGAFYDAVYALSAKQGKKYGSTAAPDIMGEASDSLAQGIADLGASVAAAPGIAIGQNIQKWATSKADAAGVISLSNIMGESMGQSAAGNAYGVARTYTAPMGGNANDPLGAGIQAGAVLNVKSSDISLGLNEAPALLINPRGLADSMAKKAFEARKQESMLKTIAALGNGTPSAAEWVQLRSIGVDADIATAVAHDSRAVFRDVSKNVFNDKNKDASRQENIEGMVMGMLAGVTDPKQRAELIKAYGGENGLKNEILKEYHGLVSSLPATRAKEIGVGLHVDPSSAGRLNFSNMFDPSVLSTTHHESTMNYDTKNSKLANGLFTLGTDISTAPAASLGRGEIIALAIRNAALRQAGGASNPRLAGNLTKLADTMRDNPLLVDEFIRGMASTQFSGYSDATPLFKAGMSGLYREHMYNGDAAGMAKASKAMGFLSKKEGELSTGDRLAYMYSRWNSMPAMNKLFTVGGLMTGDAWVGVMNGLGGINGSGPIGRPSFNGSPMAFFSSNFIRKEKTVVINGVPTLVHVNAPVQMQWGSGPIGQALGSTEKRFFGVKGYNQLTGKAAPGLDFARKIDFAHATNVVSKNANAFQKGAYFMYVYNPWQYVSGMMNGRTLEHLMWIGTKYGTVRDYEKMSRSAQWAYRTLNNKHYQNFVKVWQTGNYIMNMPAYIVADLSEAIKQKVFLKAKQLLWDQGAKLLMNKIFGQAIFTALAAVTAGVSEVLRWTYMILNTVTFGALDKIAQEAWKFIYELVIGLIIGVIFMSAVGINALTGSNASARTQEALGNGGLALPDPNFSPVIAHGDPYGNPVDPGTGEPPPIDWSKYKNISDNACPIQTTDGKSVTYCTQGANGTWSHHGNNTCGGGSSPCEYAIDMGPGNVDTQVVAPTGGTVAKVALSCGSAGTVYGVSFTTDDGLVYKFYHVIVKPDLVGKHVDKGTVMGAMIIGKSPCSTGSHVHFSVYSGGTNDAFPDAYYAKMCNLGTWSCR